MHTDKQALEIAHNLRSAASRVDKYVIDNFFTLQPLPRIELSRAAFKLRQQADAALFETAQLSLASVSDAVAEVQAVTKRLSRVIDKLDEYQALSAAAASAVGVIAALSTGQAQVILQAVGDLKAKIGELE